MTVALLEACVESVEEAREAAALGADRLELCVDLAHDGCTPPSELAAACVAAVRIPVIVMVRPRPGNFVYSGAEIDAMLRAVGDLGARGAAGFATGALAPTGEIDRSATARLVDAAGDVPVTFHRAFDAVPNVIDGLETLVDLGVRRVLTSGGAESVVAGIDRLRELTNVAAGRIEVIAAGGVRPFNVDRVVESTGVRAVHARWVGWRSALRTE